MNKRALLMVVLGCWSVTLSGCSLLFGNEGYFRSRSLDYQEAKQHQQLVFPPDVEVVARPELYPIPDIRAGDYYKPADIDDVPRPESLLSVIQDAGLEMRTDGSINWLVAERKTTELWEDLQLFFKASGIQLEVIDPESKTLITAWLQPKKKEPEGFWDSFVDFFSLDNTPNLREKFRVKLVESAGIDRHEIYVDHIRIDTSEEELPELSAIEWQSDAEEDGLVAAMYDEVIAYLSDEEVRFRRSSLFSQNLASSTSFVMTRDGNDLPVLVIQKDFNRAWIDVGEALDKSDLVVEDRNRSLGLYYVVYGKNEEGDENIFQLKLNRAENGIQVAVQLDDENIAPKDVSDEILETVKENL
ncbi:MAG: outer membrane protein assembly factor BamC [Pseudomonadales bacterium]|nr:outer membrane protein assembly factor BamC [Pseudomonadales bacterium]